MSRGAATLALWKIRLRESRKAILVGGLLLVGLLAYVAFIAFNPDKLRPFGSEHLGADVICNTYGDGGRVCFPAPEKVTEFREDRRQRLNDPAK